MGAAHPESLRCPHCQYALAGVRPRGGKLDCPECGGRFTFDTGEIRLAFWPLVAATAGVVAASGIGCAIAGLNQQRLLVAALGPLYFLSPLVAPFLFARAASRRWQEPWRSAVFIRYLVAGLMLGIVAFGVTAIGIVMLEWAAT